MCVTKSKKETVCLCVLKKAAYDTERGTRVLWSKGSERFGVKSAFSKLKEKQNCPELESYQPIPINTGLNYTLHYFLKVF